MIVHGHDETKAESGIAEGYKLLRANIAASFFSEWLTGSGKNIKGNIDKAQFLMINGKVYSVMSIINNICDAMMKGHNTAVGISISGIEGLKASNSKWLPNEGAPNSTAYAILRSEMVNVALNAVTISATFNSKYLTDAF